MEGAAGETQVRGSGILTDYYSAAASLSLGVVQGMITGIRGLCNGLGPALYGFVFYLFHVELNEMAEVEAPSKAVKPNMANPTDEVVLNFACLPFSCSGDT